MDLDSLLAPGEDANLGGSMQDYEGRDCPHATDASMGQTHPWQPPDRMDNLGLVIMGVSGAGKSQECRCLTVDC